MERYIIWLSTVAVIPASIIVAKGVNPSIGFANGFSCDAWYFAGIYEDYFGLYRNWIHSYQFYRYPALLPWIYLAPQLPSVVFHNIKFWVYLLGSAGCFAVATIVLFEPFFGALVAILFSCSTLVLGALSTDFPTGAGVMWICAVIAATAYGASRSNQIRWGIAVGVLYACCVFTHVPTIMFVYPVPLLFFATSNYPNSILSFLRFNLCGLAGFALATALLCLYSIALGAPPVFFWSEFITATHSFDPSFYPRPTDNWAWFQHDTNLPLFLIAATASVLAMARIAIWRRSLWRLAIPMIVYLLVAGLCFGWEFTGHVILQDNSFAPWMYPTAFLAIGAALALGQAPREPIGFLVCAIAAVVLSIAAMRVDLDLSAAARYAVAAVATVACVFAFWRPGATAAAAALTAVIFVNYPVGFGSTPWTVERLAHKRAYDDTQRAHDFIEANANVAGQQPLPFGSWAFQRSFGLWTTAAADVGHVGSPSYAAVAVPYSFLYCTNFAAKFPSTSDLKAAVASGWIKAGERLFIIAKGSNLAEQAKAPLASLGLVGTEVVETKINDSVSVSAIDLSAAP